MEFIKDPGRLERYFSAHRMHERLPWLPRYPWQLSRYVKWEYLCRYQEPVDRLILLLEGRVMVSMTTPHGRTHLLTFCHPGHLISGDVEVALGNRLATADVRAEDGEVWCASIPIAEHASALMEDPDFLRYGFRRLAFEMVKDSTYAVNNLLYPLEERLAAYLLEMARGGVFRENLTRTAELLGVSYRQLCRVIKGFTGEGKLKKEPDGWHLTDREALERQAAAILPLEMPEGL